MTELDGRLVFSVSGASSTVRNQIWMSDGTKEGTELIIGFETDTVSNTPTHFATLANHIVFASPDDIASEIFRVAQQPPSARSFLVEIRPASEPW